MNLLLIGIGIVIVLLVAIWVIQLISDAFNESTVGGCTCLLLLAGAILVILFILNLVSSIFVSDNSQNTISVPAVVEAPASTTPELLASLACGVVFIIAGALVIYAYQKQNNNSIPSQKIDDTNTKSKRKNDTPIVGDDGEFVFQTDKEKNAPLEKHPLSFTGSNKVKTVTREFDLDRGIYRVDYKVPDGNWLSIKIMRLSAGSSNIVIGIETDDGLICPHRLDHSE